MGSMQQLAALRPAIQTRPNVPAQKPVKEARKQPARQQQLKFTVAPAAQEAFDAPLNRPKQIDKTGSVGASGWVQVAYVNGKEGKLSFSGILAPSHSRERDGMLVNRRFMIDNRASEWFTQLVNNIAEAQGVMQVRVRVMGVMHDGEVGFIVPCARTLQAAKREWEQRQKDLMKKPQTLAECKTSTEAAEFAYNQFTKMHGGFLVAYNRETYVGVAQDGQGLLWRMSGGENLLTMADAIARGDKKLEDEVGINVVTLQIKDLDDLHRITGKENIAALN